MAVKNPESPARSLRAPSDVGPMIKRIRKQQNLTQEELSKMTGIKQQTISAIENGSQNAEMKTLFTILSIFNLELAVRAREQHLGGFAPGRN